MNVEKTSLSQGCRRKLGSPSFGKFLLPRKSGRRPGSLSEVHIPRRAEISKSKITAALQSSRFRLADTTSKSLTLFRRLRMNSGYETLRSNWMPSSENVTKTGYKTFWDRRTRSQRNYYPEAANIDKRRNSRRFAEEHKSEGSQLTEIFHATNANVLEIR